MTLSMKNQQKFQKKPIRVHEYFIEQITQAIKNTLVFYYKQKLEETTEKQQG